MDNTKTNATDSNTTATTKGRGVLATGYNPAKPTATIADSMPKKVSPRLPKAARLAAMLAIREAGYVYQCTSNGRALVRTLPPAAQRDIVQAVRVLHPKAHSNIAAWAATALHQGLYPALVRYWQDIAASK